MKLKNLLKGIDYQLIKGSVEIEVQDICYDSRLVTNTDAFVCLIGIDTDGHRYLEEVINKGCRCLIVCRKISLKIATDVTIIQISDTRKLLPYLSANLFNHPGDHLIKIAITGTKGKTSTSWMIKNILEKKGENVGLIGTLGTYINGVLYPHKNTTPESYQIQKFMRKMVDQGVKYLVMETSSQAFKVGRVCNIIFEYGLFTNLSIDHIGPREHESYEDYKKSKAQLFQQCKIGILNHDDLEFNTMTKNATCQIITYGKKDSDLLIQKINPQNTKEFLGMEFQIDGFLKGTFHVSAPGDFSVYNASCAIILTKLLGATQTEIKNGLKTFQVEGRCNIINVLDQFKVVIDFAHNKISMESIIQTMRTFHPNRIIVIFGCGGGRSFDRRYELGVVTGQNANLTIVTTDNPRNDNVDEINRDIAKGITSVQGKYLIIPDRKAAILYALKHSQKNDIILLLGKGHETYQEIKGKKYEFHEKDIIHEYIKEQQNGS